MTSTKRGSFRAQHAQHLERVEEARIIEVLAGISMENDQKERSSVIAARRWKCFSFALMAALVVATSLLLSRTKTTASHSSALSTGNNDCTLSLGTYQGQEYMNSKETVEAPTCLLESKWMKVQKHSVILEERSDALIDDWLWIDYHDRINVLVEDERIPGQEERRFLVFEQTKYALDGQKSLAVVGGIVEPHEDARDAARREVQEEMNGIQCANFLHLGTYRTDVNRGMGRVHSFVATDCSRSLPLNDSPASGLIDSSNFRGEEVGAADSESQSLKSMSLQELRRDVTRGKFLEVQWSNTVTLALLSLEDAGVEG